MDQIAGEDHHVAGLELERSSIAACEQGSHDVFSDPVSGLDSRVLEDATAVRAGDHLERAVVGAGVVDGDGRRQRPIAGETFLGPGGAVLVRIPAAAALGRAVAPLDVEPLVVT